MTMPKKRFDPEVVAEEFREEFERRCSPEVCSKSEWKDALEELIWRLKSSLDAVKSDLRGEGE